MDKNALIENNEQCLRHIAEIAPVIDNFPTSVSLPHGRLCNAKCIFCPPEIHTFSRQDEKRIDHIFNSSDKLVKYSSAIFLSDWGEPLIAKRFIDYIEHIDSVRNRNSCLGFVTNGIALSDDIIEILMDLSNSHITISLNAANKKAYKDIMGIDSFNTVISNIHKINQAKDKQRKQSPHISISAVVNSHNVSELPDFVVLCKKLKADAVILQNLMILNDSMIDISVSNDLSSARKYYTQAANYCHKSNLPLMVFKPPYYFKTSDFESFFCEEPWRSFRIITNGDVSVCCYSKKIMGNVLKEDPIEIWNGKAFQTLRRSFQSNNLLPDCQSCKKKFLTTDLK